MLAFEELVAKLRQGYVVRYEDLIVASVIKVTKVDTTWNRLKAMYRDESIAWLTLERRMYSMLPVRYHDAVKKPRKDTKEMLKKSRRALKKKKAVTVPVRSSRPVIVVDDDNSQALELARERAREERSAKNKVTRKLVIAQRKKDHALAVVKNLIVLEVVAHCDCAKTRVSEVMYYCRNPKCKRRIRKLAPIVSALITKPMVPYKLSRATERKIENIQGRVGMKERADALKAQEKEKPLGPQSKALSEELACWERIMMAKLVFKFEVGQKIRRSKRWWPDNKPGYFGMILSQELGSDNQGHKKPAYKVRWNRTEGTPSVFLEQELEPLATRRSK